MDCTVRPVSVLSGLVRRGLKHLKTNVHKILFLLGGGVLTIVVAGVAGIVSVPVLYGLNKYRRDLRLDREPYPYSFVVEEIFKLCQSLAIKLAVARFLRKDCGLECNIGRKLPDEEEARDLDADGSSSNDTYTQSFSEYEHGSRDDLSGHFSAENVSETDNYVQTVVLKDEIITTIAKDIGNQKKLDVFTSNANETPPYSCSGRKELDSPTSNVVKVITNPLTFTETSVTQNTPVELSSEKEPHEERQADNVRECEDQGDSGTEQQTREADEPNFSLPLSNQVAGHFEVSQDKSCSEMPALPEMELLIVDSSMEDEDCGEVDEKESGSETESKIANGRQALSDEEDLYGRRDVQSILPRKSTSDTFCCVREPNVANDKFVRFSRHNHYEVDTNQNWGLLEPGGINEVKTNIRIQIQKDEKGETDDQLHDGEEKPSDKETKRARRRRKRRNNKRVTTANHQGLTAGEVSDELGKNKQEQLNSNVSKKTKIVQNTSQNAGELQGKTTTPKNGKQAEQTVATPNENENKIAEGFTEKRSRKKKDKTKKNPTVKHELQPNTTKLNIFGLSTAKNADVSNSLHQEEKLQAGNNNNGGGTPVTKIMSNKQDKHEDDEDKDVVALYDDID